MTVREVDVCLVHCEWFSDNTLKKASFKPRSLQPSTKVRTYEERLEEATRMLENAELVSTTQLPFRHRPPLPSGGEDVRP
jgi:hypothetical protein